ncbi:hypothetical protein EJ07DRAFT_157182 [Lizonia empirigonia]|nr:hypothetical protein EJ07DRAFT_157182 [Lizonia empirigonia]
MLPALSGLAKRCADINGDEYLAGLWRKNLFADLLWNAYGDVKRAQPWRAPSWSWASLDGATVTHSYNDRKWIWQVQLVSASCKLASTDPTGAVSSGRLILRGKMVEGKLSKDLNAYRNGCALKFSFQGNIIKSSYFYADTECCEPGDDYITPTTTVKILLLGLTRVYKRGITGICLVLRSSDLEEHAYERIGLFYYWRSHYEKSSESEIERALDTDDEDNQADNPRLASEEHSESKSDYTSDTDAIQAEPMNPQRDAKIWEALIAEDDAKLVSNWSVPTLEYTIL